MNPNDAEAVMFAAETNAKLAVNLAFSAALSVVIGILATAVLWEYVHPTWAFLSGALVIVAVGAATYGFWMRTIRRAFRGRGP